MFEINKINAPEKFAKNITLLYLIISNLLILDFKLFFLINNDYLMIIKMIYSFIPNFIQDTMYRYIRSKKKRRFAYILTFVVIVLIVIVLYSSYSFSQFQYVLTTEGFVEMEVGNLIAVGELALVQLRGSCSELSFYISLEQALAIQEGFSEETRFRPMTHDILVDIIEGFEIEPIMVKIIKMEEDTYFADLVLQKWNRLLIVDIRPSDGIAIATRTGIPIYANEDLVTKTC